MTKLLVLGSGADLAKQKPPASDPQVLYLGIAGKVIHFIRDWDPDLHPRDPDGKFVPTPDKPAVTMAGLKKHDVILSPTGLVAVVDETPDTHEYGPGQETVAQVHLVDPVSGEITGGEQDVWAASPAWETIHMGNLNDSPLRTSLADIKREAADEPYTPEEAIVKNVADRAGRGEWTMLLEEARGFGLGGDSSLEEWRDWAKEVTDKAPPVVVGTADGKGGGLHEVKRTPPSVDQIDSIRNAADREYVAWIHSLKEELDKAPVPDPSDAALLAVADWLGTDASPAFDGAGQPHRVRAFVNRSQRYKADTPDLLVGTLRDVAPYMHQEYYGKAREIGDKAYDDALAKEKGIDPKAGPLPDAARQSAERTAVTLWMQEHVNTEWIGGETDFEHLLHPDAEVREGWIANYLEPPALDTLDPSEMDTYMAEKTRELDHAVKQGVEEARERWNRAKGRVAYDPNTEHSVELIPSKEFYDRMIEEINDKGTHGAGLEAFDPALDAKIEGRNSVSRQLVYDMAVGWSNGVKFEHDKGKYFIPQFQEVEFEPQSLEELDGLLEGTESVALDVPVFFQSGLVNDGVLQVGRFPNGDHYVHGFVDRDLDGPLAEKLEQAGADVVTNTEDLSKLFAYEGSGELYPGDMLELPDGEQTTLSLAARREFVIGELAELLDKRWDPDTAGHKGGSLKIRALEDEWRYMEGEFDANHTKAEIDAAYAEKAVEAQELARELQLHHEPDAMRKIDSWEQTAKLGRITAPKRIEYVMHNQPGDQTPDSQGLTRGAPTSQRGQLRLYGYTPEEATIKLQELGIIGDLEPEVPFKSIMRGGRRYGRVLPLHQDYVRGEADLPEIFSTVSHGITGGHQDLLTVLDTGSILPISERIRMGIAKKVASSTSQKGDVRSGLDEGVFGTVGFSKWGHEGITIFYKDDAYLRRDVIVSPTDYGAGPTRYDSYFGHKKKLYKEAGIGQVAEWDDPLPPKARQAHLDDISANDGNEWNVVGGVPVEDWSMIFVNDPSHVDEIRAKLAILKKRGLIAEVPVVTSDRSLAELRSELKSTRNTITPGIKNEIATQFYTGGGGSGAITWGADKLNEASWYTDDGQAYVLRYNPDSGVWTAWQQDADGTHTVIGTDPKAVIRRAAKGQWDGLSGKDSGDPLQGNNVLNYFPAATQIKVQGKTATWMSDGAKYRLSWMDQDQEWRGEGEGMGWVTGGDPIDVIERLAGGDFDPEPEP